MNDFDHNLTIFDSIAKCRSVLDSFNLDKVRVAYSGGSDSDCVMHLVRYCGYDVKGVFYDTGLEYTATKNHLSYMHDLGFDIEVIKAKRPIPTSQKVYGQAFISKYVSEMIERLQKHNFDFQKDGNLSFDELYKKYPKCKSALRWWTDNHVSARNNISWNKGLKEFLTIYGLPFKVSGKCCEGAKKLPIKEYTKENNIDLMLLGLRRVEGGVRSTHKNCFVPKRSYTYSMYFPLFFWKDSDKLDFENTLNIKHSDCYTEYGLKRTGCAGCPFSLHFEDELKIIDKFEPRLSKGVNNIFGKAYEWTRLYREFKDKL